MPFYRFNAFGGRSGPRTHSAYPAPLRDHAVAIRASGRVHSLGWRSASQRLGLASCRTMRQGLVLSSERGSWPAGGAASTRTTSVHTPRFERVAVVWLAE